MSKKQSKRPAPTPAKKTDLVALVRRMASVSSSRPESMVAAGVVAPMLSEQPSMGALGLVEVKLTKAEEAVLARPVDPRLVSIKPTGQPYIPHANYTRWFNEAFGRTGWSLVPASAPRLSAGERKQQVVAAFLMHVHGKPVAFAWGEQEYYTNNREQSYGDALEATTASGMRRCAKRLGVGLELWDREWLDNFIREHCLQVRVRDDRNGEITWKWRRRDQAKFYGELDPSAVAEARPAQRHEAPEWDERPARSSASTSAPRPAGTDRTRGEKISEKQVKRLHAIISNSGRDVDVVRKWILDEFGYTSTADITRNDYEHIWTAIEAEDNLPRRLR